MPESHYKKNAEFERVVRTLSISLYQRDMELLDGLATFLGCSKSEAVRTAVRAMVAQLGVIRK